MVSLIGGIVALILGILGLVFWWGHFLAVIMGALPFFVLLGGAVAIYGGITSIKDRIEEKREKEKKEEAKKKEEKEEKKEEKEPKEKEKKK